MCIQSRCLLQFQRFVAGARDYQSPPYAKQDLIRLQDCAPKQQRKILADESWAKAVFFRDPAERLLSAFLSEAPRGSSLGFHKGPLHSPAGDLHYTFAKFVEIVAKRLKTPIDGPTECPDWRWGGRNWHTDQKVSSDINVGLNACTNPLWRPQHLACGLSKLLPLFQFVGRSDQSAVHTRRLLKKVGLWDGYGQAYADATPTACGALEKDTGDANAGFNQNPAGSPTDMTKFAVGEKRSD